jgi:hypothetical protein
MSAGTCIFCGCTEDKACRLPNGDTCCWTTKLRNKCSAPGCIRAHRVMQKRHGEELLELRKQASDALSPGQSYMKRKRERERRYGGRKKTA